MTSYKDLILFSSLDYFISYNILEPNPWLTTIFQDLSAGNPHADRVSTLACIDYVNRQGSLRGQDPSVRAGEIELEYKEIKVLYKENTIILVLLIFI